MEKFHARHALLVIVLLALAVVLPTLWNEFTLDTQYDLTGNRFITEPGHVGEMLSSDYLTGSALRSGFWRPLVLLTNWVLWRIGGGSPVLFFLVNALLHVGTSTAVFLLARRLGGTVFAAFAAGALFAVHPLHMDVLGGVVGLKDLAATAAFICGLLLLLRSRAAQDDRAALAPSLAAGVVFLAGLLFKESVIALVPVFILIDVAAPAPRRRRIAMYAALGTALFLKFSGQWLVLRGPESFVAIESVDNPLVGLGFLARKWHALGFLGRAVTLFLWPASLSPDYSYNALPLHGFGATAFRVAGAVVLLVVLAASVWAWSRRQTYVWAALAVVVGGYLPTSNLLVTIGSNFAERFLYLPSIGLCLLAGHILARPRWPRRLAVGFTLVLVVAGLGRSVAANGPWHDNVALWSHVYEVFPKDMKAVLSVSFYAEKRGHAEYGLDVIDRALNDVDPVPETRGNHDEYIPALRHSRGIMLADLDRLEEAETDMRAAITARPATPTWIMDLAVVLKKCGRFDDAAAAFRQALAVPTIKPIEREGALHGLANLEAAPARAGGAGPGASIPTATANPAASTASLAVRADQAIRLAQAGNLREAEAEFRELRRVEPSQPLHAFNLGLVLADEGRTDDARQVWEELLRTLPAGGELSGDVAARLHALPRTK